MSDILNIYTADQLYNMWRLKILADNVGLTDFNDGSKVKALVQSTSDIVSSISMDYKEAIYNAIPIALYQGLGFPAKGATKATGFIRPYRHPQMTIRYHGVASSVLLTISPTQLSVTCTGAPSDVFTALFSTYTTVGDLVTHINTITNWSANSVSSATPTTSLYQYSGVEILGSYTYLNQIGFDIMLQTDAALSIITGYSVTINSMQILTTSDATILAGKSGINIPANNTTAGVAGNISADAIDTEFGQGTINSSVQGINGVTNDTAFSGGSDAETPDQRRLRFIQAINALNAGTEQGIISALSTISGVKTVGIEPSTPSRGSNTIILDDGSNTISGTLLSKAEKILYGDPDDLVNYPGKGVVGIDYFFSAPTIVSVSISITITRLATINVDPLIIQNAVQTAIAQYINSLTLGADVILSEVTRVAKNANSAVYDASITSPTSNIPISGGSYGRTGGTTGGVISVTVLSTGTI